VTTLIEAMGYRVPFHIDSPSPSEYVDVPLAKVRELAAELRRAGV
jgi:hypothetical protein